MPRYSPSTQAKSGNSNFVKLSAQKERLRFLDVPPEERQRNRVWDKKLNKPVDFDPDIHKPEYEVIFVVERIGADAVPMMLSLSPYAAELLSEDLVNYEAQYGVGGFYMDIWKDTTNNKTMTRFRFASVHKPAAPGDEDLPF